MYTYIHIYIYIYIYVYIYIYMYMYIYIYIYNNTRFQKRCNLKIYMKYIYILFFSPQNETLCDEKLNKMCIYFIFVFKLQRFRKRMYIHIYTCMCFYI